MSYQITITRIETNTVTKRGPYCVIDEVPWTQEQLCSAQMYESKEAFLAKNPLKKIHGYGPDVQTQETEAVEVLKQTVDELDLRAVLRAVLRASNNL
jgi:hypothetical protein